MNYETYESFDGDCVLCEKKAEVIYIEIQRREVKFRKLCKKCARIHSRVKKD